MLTFFNIVQLICEQVIDIYRWICNGCARYFRINVDSPGDIESYIKKKKYTE